MRTFLLLCLLPALILLPTATVLAKGGTWKKKLCQKDVAEALDVLDDKCGHFFKQKGIDWRKVSRRFKKEAKAVKTPGEHYKLLVRLVARLEDGHAYVKKVGEGEAIEWPDPDPGPQAGPGMFLCRVGEKVYVKNSFSTAKELGIEPGMQVLRIAEMPALRWLDAMVAERGDTMGFSTDHQAFAAACHWGLAQARGSRCKVEVQEPGGRKRTRTISYRKASYVPWGAVFFPEGLGGDRDVKYGRTKSGVGYIHLRKCPSNLPERIDEALAALDDPDGLIVDLRANGGGGFDHEGFLGRFVPKGKSLRFGKRYESAGPRPYGGPVVVIVDALTRSAGETTAAIFKEDGRAWLIGESPTAGMSSSKQTLPLPSGLFALYVSVHSNMARSNGGRGIEGIGIPPHEVVPYDPQDLARGIDTQIRRAEEVLQEYPRDKVPYDPRDFGWRD